MWQKIKCLLGWHEWETIEYSCKLNERCAWFEDSGYIVCRDCQDNEKVCKHCGKVKR